MKFNWGNGLTVAMIIFIGFILTMVFKMVNTHNDVYAPDYYEQEMAFQGRIDAKNNVSKLSGKFAIDIEQKEVKIQFPTEFNDKKVIGKITLYRPDNAGLDRVIPINLTGNKQYISKEILIGGLYDLKIDCISDGIQYFHEQPIKIK